MEDSRRVLKRSDPISARSELKQAPFCGTLPPRRKMYIQLTVFTRLQPIQRPIADANPYKSQGGKSNCSSHPPYLPVFPLSNGEFQPTVGHSLSLPHRWYSGPQRLRLLYLSGPGGQGAAVPERNAPCQGIYRLFTNQAFYLHMVGFPQLVFWICDLLLQAAVIGEYQQSLGIVVQTSGSAKSRHIQIVRKCGPALGIGELAKHLKRLIEQYDFGHVRVVRYTGSSSKNTIHVS